MKTPLSSNQPTEPMPTKKIEPPASESQQQQPPQPEQKPEAHVPSTKRFPKPSVDIDALRKAIHDSLKKQADASEAAAEKKPEA